MLFPRKFVNQSINQLVYCVYGAVSDQQRQRRYRKRKYKEADVNKENKGTNVKKYDKNSTLTSEMIKKKTIINRSMVSGGIIR